MARPAPKGEVFAYKVIGDERGLYLQMYKPKSTKMLKSLLIQTDRMPMPKEGEAWIETNGSEVVCCMPLQDGLVTGYVEGVSHQVFSVRVGQQVGRFMAAWGPAVSQVKRYDRVRVDINKQRICVIPGDGTQLPEPQTHPPAPAPPQHFPNSPSVSAARQQYDVKSSLPSASVSRPQPEASYMATQPIAAYPMM